MSTLSITQLLSPPEGVEQEAQARVSALRRDDVANTRVGTAFSASLASPEVTKRAYEDVWALASTIRHIRVSFAVVYNLLTLWYELGIQDQGHTLMLGPKWHDLQNNFEAALKASIQIAPGAAATMNTVKDILASAPGKRHGDLKARLQAFMQEVKEKEKQALEVKNQFQDVVDHVRMFWPELERALEIPIIDRSRKAALGEINKRLATLTKQLEGLQQKLVTLETTAMSQISSGGSGAVLVMLSLCPNAFMAALEQAFKDGDSESIFTDEKRQKQIVENEIKKTQASMGDVIQEEAAMTLYREVMGDPKAYIDSVAFKIDTIVNIWQTINLDMHALYTDLSTNMSDDAPVTVFLLSKMKVTKDIYGKLSWLLDQYVEAMKSI